MKELTSKAGSWWADREPRERWMLATMLTLIGAFVLWYGVLTPLNKLRLASQRNYDQAAAELQAIQQDMRQLQGTTAKPMTAERIESSAKAVGLKLEHDTHAGEKMVFRLSGVRADTLFGWLDTLRVEGGAPLELHIMRSVEGLEARVVFAGAAR